MDSVISKARSLVCIATTQPARYNDSIRLYQFMISRNMVKVKIHMSKCHRFIIYITIYIIALFLDVCKFVMTIIPIDNDRLSKCTMFCFILKEAIFT